MHKILRAISFLVVLGGCLYLAAPALAADSTPPANTGAALTSQEGKALKDKMEQDREQARALHKKMRDMRLKHREEMRKKHEGMMKNRPTGAGQHVMPTARGQTGTPALSTTATGK